MARTKKVVSKKLAKLIERRVALNAIIKANKKAYSAFIRAYDALDAVEGQIQVVRNVEAAKAAAKAAE